MKHLKLSLKLLIFLVSNSAFAFEEITSMYCNTPTLNSEINTKLSIRTNIMLDLGYWSPFPPNNLGNDLTFERILISPIQKLETPQQTGRLKMTKEKSDWWEFEGTLEYGKRPKRKIKMQVRLIRYGGHGEPDFAQITAQDFNNQALFSYDNCSLGLTH